ncbi:hypothetical protein DPX16_20718 [Anabarilius grahami]|uniref:Uncharacterized protein n=1 Tax=Anabarilius grahami TaxID=495550 RepID=A0A3N0YQ76_ANAGA|nr:hypothetical protein DPX16_20718 [Anabarilius grahami]
MEEIHPSPPITQGTKGFSLTKSDLTFQVTFWMCLTVTVYFAQTDDELEQFFHKYALPLSCMTNSPISLEFRMMAALKGQTLPDCKTTLIILASPFPTLTSPNLLPAVQPIQSAASHK